MNKTNPAIKRIMAEVRELEKNPSYRYSARPLEDNMFEWHFTIRGPVGTDFEGGIYHGRILLPPEYPLKPPNIVFLNHNGRFVMGTKICLSISAYHEETWQPAWSIRTMLEALISFLPTEGGGAIGAIDWSKEERQRLAKASHTFYCKRCDCYVKDLLTEPTAEELAAERGGGTAPPEMKDAISQLSIRTEGGAAEAAGAAGAAGAGGEGEGFVDKISTEEADRKEKTEGESTAGKSNDVSADEDTWREIGSSREDQKERDGAPGGGEKESDGEAAANADAGDDEAGAASPPGSTSVETPPRGAEATTTTAGEVDSSAATPTPAPAPAWVETPPSVLAIRRRILKKKADAESRAEDDDSEPTASSSDTTPGANINTTDTSASDSADARDQEQEQGQEQEQIQDGEGITAVPSVAVAPTPTGNDLNQNDAESSPASDSSAAPGDAAPAMVTAVRAPTPAPGSSGPLRARVDAVNIRSSEQRHGLTPQSAAHEAAQVRAPGELTPAERQVEIERMNLESRRAVGKLFDHLNWCLSFTIFFIFSIQLIKIIDGSLHEEFQPKYQPDYKPPFWQTG